MPSSLIFASIIIYIMLWLLIGYMTLFLAALILGEDRMDNIVLVTVLLGGPISATIFICLGLYLFAIWFYNGWMEKLKGSKPDIETVLREARKIAYGDENA